MLVWLNGATSSGKTWLGDFLQVYHDWIHIDGDRRICLLYNEGDITKNMSRSFCEYWFKGKDAPLELWVPYYKELCARIAKQYYKTPKTNIVLTFVAYPRAVRDYLREEVRKLTGENLIHVLLEVSEENYAKRQRVKLDEWLKAADKTAAEIWAEHEGFRSFGEFSEENLNRFYQLAKGMKGLEPIQVDEENSFTIDTNNGHVKVVPEITRILKLSDTKNFDNEAIVKVRTERIISYGQGDWELRNNRADQLEAHFILSAPIE